MHALRSIRPTSGNIMFVDRQMRRIVIAANVRRPDTPPHRLRHVHSGTGTGKRIDNDVAGFRKEPQQVLHHLRRHGAEVGLTTGVLVSRRELPDVEVLARVRWGVCRRCGKCHINPASYGFVVSTLERRIFPADDLSDIALAVTVEPQVIGAIRRADPLALAIQSWTRHLRPYARETSWRSGSRSNHQRSRPASRAWGRAGLFDLDHFAAAWRRKGPASRKSSLAASSTEP